MKPKVKISIVIGLTLASLVFANFAFAAPPIVIVGPTPGLAPDITAAELQSYNTLAKKIVDDRYAGGDVSGDLTRLKSMCKSFGDRLAQMTGTIAGTSWNTVFDDSSLMCWWGRYQGTSSTPDNLGRNITVARDTTVDTFRIQKATGASILDSGKIYKAQVEAQNQNANLKLMANPLSTAIGWVLDILFSLFANFLGLITSLAAGILSTALAYTFEVTTMPTVVTVGWGIVRDISNMFFILALIVMALATILQIGEEYNYKRLLPKLVLAALLVNFSLVISVTIMNAVNFVAAIFYNNGMFKDIVKTIYQVANPLNALGEAAQGGWMGAVTAGLGKNIFMLVGAVVFIALTAMFIIRLVGLYVLIIFSPIAYVANILPATQKYAEEWWSHFLKYLIWAPVALFMIRLTILVVQNDSQFQWTGGGAPDSSFTYFILCAFLAAALVVAQKAGMVGGDMIINTGKKVGMFAGKWAMGAAGQRWNEFMGHKYENAEARAKAKGKEVGWGTKALFAAANPINSVKAWMEYSQKQRHLASERAKATSMEIVQEARSGVKIPHREFLAMKEEREAAKQFMNMAPGKKMQMAEQLDKLNTHEGAIMRRGLWTAAIIDNHIEDMLSNPYFARDHMDANGSISSVSAVHDFMGRFLRMDPQYNHGHVDADSQRFVGSDMNEISSKNGRWDYDGHGEIDPDGNYKDNMRVAGTAVNKYGTTVRNFVDNGHKAYALNDLSKQGSRNRMQAQVFNYADQVFDVDASGNLINKRWVAGIDDYKRAAIGMIDEGSQREAHFAPARNVMALVPGDVVHTPDPATDAHVMTFKYRDQYDGFIRSWADNPDAIRVHFAKKLGVQNPGENGKKIKNFTIELRDATGAVLGTRLLHTGEPAGAWSYDISKKTLS